MATTTYGLSSTNATTVTTARKLITPAPNTTTTVSACKIAKTTGWFVMAPQGSSNTNNASEPSFGNTQGYILDDTSMEGLILKASSISVSVRVSQSSGSGTWVPHVLIGKRSSAGVFSPIVDIACTSTSGVGSTLTTITGSGTPGSDTTFNTGDKLYVNLYFDLTANLSSSNTATASIGENSSSDFITITTAQNLTKTQSSVSRIRASVSATQAAIAHISAASSSVTQTAIARIQNTFTAAQTAIAHLVQSGTLASDTYTRTIAVNSGWGSDDLGNAWTTFQGTTQTTTDFGVDGTEGTMNISAASSNRTALLGGVSVGDFDVKTKVQISSTPVGGSGTSYYILPRTTVASAGRTGYRFQLQQAPTNNNGTIFIKSVLNGTETQIASVSVGTLTPSSWYWLRAIGIGSSLAFKAWADGSPEPDWQLIANNTTYTSGVVGIMGFVGSGGTNLPTILWDNLTVTTDSARWQFATARIQVTPSLTQNAIARIQFTNTKTQPAIANISASAALSKTQTSIARIQKSLTAIQTAIARLRVNRFVTQTAIARIRASSTKAQVSTARVQVTATKAQTAIARIQKTAITKTQSSVSRIQNTAVTKTQASTAHIQSASTKTQTAIATIVAPYPVPVGALLFSDEFTGSSIDTTKWAAKTGSGSSGTVWGGFTNVSLDGQSSLLITATGSGSAASGWTSAFISAKSTSAYSGPRYMEARAICPGGAGPWSAPIWEWDSPFGANGYENDVNEQLGFQPTNYHTTAHSDATHQDTINNNTGVTLANAYHQYGAAVYADHIDYYFDGVKIQTILSSALPTWPFVTNSFVLNIDLQMGGWGGTISVTGPVTMYVDYVRVYQIGEYAVQPAIARIKSTVSKTQSSVARIQNSVGKTQTAKARMQVTGIKTQTSVTRLQSSFTKTQPAIARIQNSLAKTQSSVARLQATATKIQAAKARIQNSLTKLQLATARIQITSTKTHLSLARIQSSITKTQISVARISRAGMTQVQSAKVRIQTTIIKTQPAISRIQTTGIRTQTGTARISAIVTKIQVATAHIIAAGSFTKSQTSTARIQNNITKLQHSVARIASIGIHTQTAKSRIIGIYIRTQIAVASITTVRTKTQSSTARLQKDLTKIQPSVARIAATGVKTQTAIARLQSVGSATQRATANILFGVVLTKSQSAKARIALTGTTTQTAIAKISLVITKSQTATARVVVARSWCQIATARIAVPVQPNVHGGGGTARPINGKQCSPLITGIGPGRVRPAAGSVVIRGRQV